MNKLLLSFKIRLGIVKGRIRRLEKMREMLDTDPNYTSHPDRAAMSKYVDNYLDYRRTQLQEIIDEMKNRGVTGLDDEE